VILDVGAGDPATNAPTNVAEVFALDPGSGAILWQAEDFPGLIFAPVGAVPGVAFVGTAAGTFAALDTRTGARLWTHDAPARTGCGPSIANGRVLWGYGFTLFSGPGDGGIISFALAR
jgi:polyvinyl alcohol dehydrogenase (cytochrome)